MATAEQTALLTPLAQAASGKFKSLPADVLAKWIAAEANLSEDNILEK